MSKFSVVAIGASAGGLKALREIFSSLPVDFPASVLVVQHLDPHHKSLMAVLLQRESKIKVKEAENGENILARVVYVAPPNKHMLATEGRIELTMTAFVHFSRPSIDLLLESVSASYDCNSIGVILTGTGSYGSIGIKAIKERGWLTIAQDEETSEQFGMPESAIKGERMKHFSTSGRRKDSIDINISLTISPVKDKDGNIIGTSTIAHEIHK